MYFYSSEINSASIKTRKSVLKGTLFDGDQKLLEEISIKVVFSVVQKLVSELSVSTRVLVDWSKELWNQHKASVRRREESDDMHILPLLSGLYPL